MLLRDASVSLDHSHGVTQTLDRDTAERSAGAVMVTLRVLGALARPGHYALREGVICRLGSELGCDIVVSEPTVSRAHAELRLTPDGIAVRDLGSRNGTFYLGQRVENATIAVGASITLGRVTIVLDGEAAPTQAEYVLDDYERVIGRSPQMKRLFAVLARIESSLTPVLLGGESGAGKEVVARAIHARSLISSRPFVALNCGALPRDLVGSELFGHRKGAFTGAVEARKGAFETADGGTLFLDEIGELPLETQPILLRALETGEVRPLGGDLPKSVKVRVIAATNRDLEEDVRNGRFREDLFYRLAVLRVTIPRLRERMEDIEPLARHFAAEAGHVGALSGHVIEQLKARRWSGIVRELRNTIQAYVALGVLPEPSRSQAATLDLALREMVDPRVPYGTQKDVLIERFTALYLSVLLEATGGNQTIAARWAQLDRGYVGQLLAKHFVSKKR